MYEPIPDRKALRNWLTVAQSLRERLQYLKEEADCYRCRPLEMLMERSRQLGVSLSRWTKANARRWPAAAKRMDQRCQRLLPEIRYLVDQAMGESNRTIDVPPVRTIFEEMCQAQAEFGSLHVDAKRVEVSVVTDPITLEDVPLGPFRLTVQVDPLRLDRPDLAIRAEALDPNPAAICEGYTHPHVSDQRICLGEAILPIRAALESGRLADVFCLARSVLETYNPDSPYVTLADWHGQPCSDCGYVASEDETTSCAQCQETLCSECLHFCRCCDEGVCAQCLTTCEACEELICRSCLSTCPVCGQDVCSDCLTCCQDCERTLCTMCQEDEKYPCQPNRKDAFHEEDEEQEDQEEDNQPVAPAFGPVG